MAWKMLIVGMLLIGLTSQLFGQGFTENFDYDPGDLTEQSGGLWFGHGGQPPDIQVENCRCILTSPGSMDNSRDLEFKSGLNDFVYFAIEFAVDVANGTQLIDDYFVHLTRSAKQGHVACLKLTLPVDPEKDFSLGILATPDSKNYPTWNQDFEFGERIVAVVRWNNTSGESTLWINPPLELQAESTAEQISDINELAAESELEFLSLRQNFGSAEQSSKVTINRLAVGQDFGVLLSVSFDPLIQLGDINRDCRINLLDIGPFVELITSQTFDPVGDMNFDGVVNLLDVAPFVEILTSS